jgi:hypothetical protein
LDSEAIKNWPISGVRAKQLDGWQECWPQSFEVVEWYVSRLVVLGYTRDTKLLATDYGSSVPEDFI